MKNFFLLIGAVFFIACSSDDDTSNGSKLGSNEEQGVKYKVEVSFNWSATNFPVNYPSNDHFSPLIGWVHNSKTTFFNEGAISSTGIKQMAETGATSIIKNELKDKINSGEGLEVVSGSGLGSGTGVVSVEIEVTKENSLVTLATMIAPSPDWYVALVGANLYENGSFIEQKTFEAYPYDAGTDSGTTYTSANKVTSPIGKITKILSSPFNTNKTIATVKFIKQ